MEKAKQLLVKFCIGVTVVIVTLLISPWLAFGLSHLVETYSISDLLGSYSNYIDWVWGDNVSS